jgi:hypothetical protein
MNGTLLLIRKVHTFYFVNLAWECLDELAQFKARLQFRRTHQPGKPTFKQASLKEYNFNWTDSESQVKVHQPRDWFLSQQRLVTLRRGHPKGPEITTVSLQDSTIEITRVSATNKVTVTQIEYSVAGQSRGRVTLCAVYTVHVETRSVSFLVEPQNQGQ